MKKFRPILEDLEGRSLLAVIAILGTGTDPVGPLAGHVLRGMSEVASGQPGDVDPNGHDTLTASVALGADPTGVILPIQIAGADGQTAFPLIASGIEDAIALGATVISCSFAGYPNPGIDPNTPLPNLSRLYAKAGLPTLDQALDDADRAGIPVIFAAGNASNNNDLNPVYPAQYAHWHTNVAAVAAVDSSGQLASFSNFGTNSVALAALGVDVPAFGTNGYPTRVSGTSFAAPYIAALAGEIRDVRPREAASGVIGDLRGLVNGPSIPVGFGGAILPVVPPTVPPELPDPVPFVIHHGHKHPVHVFKHHHHIRTH